VFEIKGAATAPEGLRAASESVVAPGKVVADCTVVAEARVVAGAVVTDVGEVVVVVGDEPVNHGKNVVDTAVDCGAVDGGVTGDANWAEAPASDAARESEGLRAGDWVPPPASTTLGIPRAPMLTAVRLARKRL
jgi:hypothetical protein